MLPSWLRAKGVISPPWPFPKYLWAASLTVAERSAFGESVLKTRSKRKPPLRYFYLEATFLLYTDLFCDAGPRKFLCEEIVLVNPSFFILSAIADGDRFNMFAM